MLKAFTVYEFSVCTNLKISKMGTERKTVSELLPYYYCNLRTLAEVVSSQSRGRCRLSSLRLGQMLRRWEWGWGWWVGGKGGREGGGLVEQEGGGWQFHSSDYTCPTSHGARSLHHSVGEQGGGRYRKDYFVQLRDCPTSSLKCGGAKSLPLGGIIPPSPRQSFISILAKLCHAGDPFISAQTPSTHSTQFW